MGEVVLDNEWVAVSSQAPVASAVMVRHHTFITHEVRSAEDLPAPSDLHGELPSECWWNNATLVTYSLERFFVEMLPDDARIERVYWTWGEEALRIWAVIPEPDFSIQEPIYEAQLAFMDKFPEYLFDFHIIYRFGRPHEAVKPQGSRRVK